MTLSNLTHALLDLGRISEARTGAAELVARWPENADGHLMTGFVGAAVALATNPARLAVLRSGLRDRMAASPVCDAARAAREFEEALATFCDESRSCSR